MYRLKEISFNLPDLSACQGGQRGAKMKITKKVVGKLEKCYSLSKLFYAEKEHFLVAAEKVDRCILYDLDGNYEETIWEQPGGVMSMVQVPGTDGQFLATQRFYSPNDSGEASIVIAAPGGEEGWSVRTLVKLPFVHRFDILQAGTKRYLIACTIKSAHKYKDDWTSPGKVYACILPEDLSGFHEGRPLELKVIKDGMLKNHGYYRHKNQKQEESAVISCEQGVFRFTPPAGEEEEWKIEKLIGDAASDALLLDLDQDGEEELVVISPFHGNRLKIYKKDNDIFRTVYTHPHKLDFLHAFWGGILGGRPIAVIGSREGERFLLAVSCDDQGQYQAQELDRGCGAANVMHVRNHDKDIIIAANREINEIAMYMLE